VSDVIAKALDVNPNARFQTAAELEAELAALQRAHEATSPETGRPSTSAAAARRRAVRAVAVVLLIPLFVGLLGFLNTAAFNLTLGRTAPFDSEPAMAWLAFGLRSLVAPLFYMTVTIFV